MNFNNLHIQNNIIIKDLQRKLKKVFKHGQYIFGPEVLELENKLSVLTNSNKCLAVSSGTDALFISLMALGIKKGDEIITTVFSYISTVEVIVRLGAIPIMVDINENDCNINENLIEKNINKRTKAIIIVSLFGQVPNLKKINQISKKYGNIPIIEDGAQSFGARYFDKMSCGLTTIGCTSFFPSKPLGCYGDGGAVFTNNILLFNKMKILRNHGQIKKNIHNKVGISARMDTIQCAIVLAKLKLFNKEIKLRNKVATIYNKAFDDAGIKRIAIHKNKMSVYAQYSIFLKERKKAIILFKKNKIPYNIYYPLPINEQVAYRKYKSNLTPVAKKISKKIISIPMGPYLKLNEQLKIINLICSKLK